MLCTTFSNPAFRQARAISGIRGLAALAAQSSLQHQQPQTPLIPTVSADVCHSMPPGFKATAGNFQTFVLPDKVSSSCRGHVEMGMDMVNAWRRDGIIQVAMSPEQQRTYQAANQASRRFFARTPTEKKACVDANSYSGYVGSGEEITNGIADYSEIFTVTKDIQAQDQRMKEQWPCHGPCPWPNTGMKRDVDRYMKDLGNNGDKLLQLIELGLDVPLGSLTSYVDDGWHHARILRFPPANRTNGKGKKGRGIGSHTDYGLLVIAAQDDVGGLFIRPPQQNEHFANWKESAAGLKEDESGWVYVPPVPGVFTVFPGDMMQYVTGSFLPSTPHKVGLNTRERFAFAYFHEPNFKSVVRPLEKYVSPEEMEGDKGIHYGTHFTNMCLRNYPDRITTHQLKEDGRYSMLATQALRDESTGLRCD